MFAFSPSIMEWNQVFVTPSGYFALTYEIFSCRGKGRKYNPRGRTASRHPVCSLQAVKSAWRRAQKNCLCAAVIDISKWCGNNMDKLHLEGSFRLSYIPVRHKLIRKYQKERKKKMIGMQRDEYNTNRFYQFLYWTIPHNCYQSTWYTAAESITWKVNYLLSDKEEQIWENMYL